jgi:hypothetical protein
MLTLALHGRYFLFECFKLFARSREHRFLHIKLLSRHEIEFAQNFLDRLIVRERLIHTCLIPDARKKRQPLFDTSAQETRRASLM